MSTSTIERAVEEVDVDVDAIVDAYWRVITATGRTEETRLEHLIRYTLIDSAIEGKWYAPKGALTHAARVCAPGMEADDEALAAAARYAAEYFAAHWDRLPLTAGSVPAAMLLVLDAVCLTASEAAKCFRDWPAAEAVWIRPVIEAVHSKDGTGWDTLIGWIEDDASEARKVTLTTLSVEHGARIRTTSYIAPSVAKHPVGDTIVARTVTSLDDLPDTIRDAHGRKKGLVPGILYTHGDINGAAAWSQYATDDEVLRKEGHKYLSSVGEQKPMLHPIMAERLAEGALDTLVWVEGTKQHLAAVTLYRDKPATLVMGGAGCWGWGADKVATAEFLAIVRAAQAAGAAAAVVMMDADSRTNRDVWLAADRLHDIFVTEGFEKVLHPKLPTAMKTGGNFDDQKLGLDDWLSRQYGDPGE